MFDVIAVQIKAPHTVRIMDRNMTSENAEAYIKMAVIRRGVDDEFFKAVPAAKYRDGDNL
ncbi:MAG: hypothetical protein WB760_26430 [Xanthobacteraceae bacterium]